MNDDLHELASLYALDALDDAERATFETHLADCDRCRAEVDDVRRSAASWADDVATAPPASLRRSVLDQIADTPQQPAPRPTPVDELATRRRSRLAPLLAAAAALIVIVVGAAVLVRDGSNAVDDVLAAPDAVTTVLELTTDGEAGSFRVVWSAEQDRVVAIAEGLPDPGPDQAYELWAIVDGTPVPAGLFTTDDGAVRAVAEIDDIEAAAWGVTIEPAAGSTAPTTPIVFFAEA